MTDDATARVVYVATTGGLASEYDALPITGRYAWRAFAELSVGDPRYAPARQVALDARRDALAAGLFTPAAMAEAARRASSDSAVRNQRPTGAYNELSGKSDAIGSNLYEREPIWWYRPGGH